MRFHFRLRPVEEIALWGGDRERPNLHWFALTDGWFWIEAGDQELFRYSREIQKHWQQVYPEALPSPLPYEDYQVARYEHDLWEMLPAILHPLPDDLAARVADAEEWSAWQETLRRHWPGSPENSLWDTYPLANDWWHLRTWEAFHLAYPPQLWLWRVSDVVHVRWDNRAVLADGIPVWEARQGEITVSVTEFITAAEDFNSQFLAAMRARVDAARAAWPRPDVYIDLDSLERGQKEQSGGLDVMHVLQLVEWTFTWDEVREAMAAIEQSLSQQAAFAPHEEQE